MTGVGMASLTFFLPAILLTVLAVGLVILGLLRGAQARDSGDARDMRIYADQLREIERDAVRGVVSDDEAARLRTETARRLLEADRRTRAETRRSPVAARLGALGLVLAAAALSVGVYSVVGVPALADLPMAQRLADARQMRDDRATQGQMEAAWQSDPTRPPQPVVEAQYLLLMEQLRSALVERPGDLRGLRLLATNEANIGNHSAAAAAWVRVIEAEGDAATSADDLVQLVENMALATGGLISAEAETVMEHILRLDPRNGTARYYLGLMFAQTGRPDLTFRLWRGLLEDSAADDPWVPAIRGTIEELAQIAGVRYTLPPPAAALPGPDAAALDAAADMTDAERQQMIGGMVEGLAARLASSGGTPDEWARLINALGTLGQTERARAIWTEALQVFATSPEALVAITAAARAQGFTE